MYPVVITVHNLLRWVILILGLWTLTRAVQGWSGKMDYRELDRRAGTLYTIALDIQLLVGLLLFFAASPLTKSALQDFSSAMESDTIRFFVLEHTPFMLLGWAFAHVGNAVAKRADTGSGKHRRAAIWFGLSLLVTVLAIPWSRPLLRLGL